METKKIWLSLAKMSGREQDFIQEAFETNWVVPLGPNVDGFEHDLQNYLGEDRQVVALSAGTAALHLALIQLDVKAGDEVICQSFTFVASANPITYLGATPVFIDSEAETWNMDPLLLETAIQDRFNQTGKYPKAIIPVHLYGMPAKMKEILAIASGYNIPVLEDAAEALGSEYKGKSCGTFGDFGVLSFNGNKMITTSGGGALICRTSKEASRTKFYATQARDNAPHYQHSEIGYNYRMSNICAGIGRGQMYVLESHLARRREIHSLYLKKLSGLKGLTVFDKPSAEYESNFWLTCIQVNPVLCGFAREEVRMAMDAANIETRPLWKPMHLQPVFAGAPYYGNGIAEHLFENGLCLPSGPNLTDVDIERVVDVIQGLYSKVASLAESAENVAI
ncbi:MAG TPA: DegT/DnrJ/EryC1/StrS family aminotransferase [Prolixibacteraceae bacterium]